MSKDISAIIAPRVSIAPVAVTGTVEGVGVDVSDCDSFAVVIPVGVITTLNATDKLTATVLLGPDSTIGNATAVDAAGYINPRDSDGDDWDRILDASAEAARVYYFGVMNLTNSLFAFVKLTAAGSPSVVLAAAIVKGNLRVAPK